MIYCDYQNVSVGLKGLIIPLVTVISLACFFGYFIKLVTNVKNNKKDQVRADTLTVGLGLCYPIALTFNDFIKSGYMNSNQNTQEKNSSNPKLNSTSTDDPDTVQLFDQIQSPLVPLQN